APVSLANNFDITLDDSTDTIGRTVTMNVVNGVGTVTGLTGPAAPITFGEGSSFPGFGQEFDFISIKGGSGGNTFNILNTPADFTVFDGNVTTTNLLTGSGDDTVNVFATSSRDLNIQGVSGRDLVHIGNNGSLDGIQSPVHVANTGNFTTLS